MDRGRMVALITAPDIQAPAVLEQDTEEQSMVMVLSGLCGEIIHSQQMPRDRNPDRDGPYEDRLLLSGTQHLLSIQTI